MNRAALMLGDFRWWAEPLELQPRGLECRSTIRTEENWQFMVRSSPPSNL